MSSQQQFDAFINMKYADQSIAFLNAYWLDYESEAENIWNYTQKVIFFSFILSIY